MFANWDSFLRVFLPADFTSQFLWNEIGIAPLRIFWIKMGPMSKDFSWKSNRFEWRIPVCLNMRVPLPSPRGLGEALKILFWNEDLLKKTSLLLLFKVLYFLHFDGWQLFKRPNSAGGKKNLPESSEYCGFRGILPGDDIDHGWLYI